MLEIDVDVGRLAALGADEALEQQIQARRIDGGDAEAVADRRVRRRAAALAEDVARPRLAHDVVDGEKIGRVVERADQRQLVLDLAPHFLRHAAGIARAGAEPGKARQLLLRRAALGHRIDGIFVAQLVERESDARRDLGAARHRLGISGEQPRHLVGRLHVPLGIGEEPEAGFVERAMFADAGQHVVQAPARRHVIMHIVGGDERRAVFGRERRQAGEPRRIVAAIKMLGGEKGFGAVDRLDRGEKAAALAAAILRQHDGDLAFGKGGEIGKADIAFALGRAPAAEAEQGRKPAVSGAILGQTKQAATLGQIEPRADHELDARALGGNMGAHDAGQRVAVGDRDRREPKRRRAFDQLLGMRRAAEEAEIGGDLELGVGEHVSCRHRRPQNLGRPNAKRARHGPMISFCS